jgi:osmoprotectant transport system permease protein
MGLTPRQMLWRVELPLAVPAIIAGLRIAVVSTISIATIAAFLLPKGLGYPIFVAIGNPTPFNIALALVCDGFLVLVRRLLVPWARLRFA